MTNIRIEMIRIGREIDNELLKIAVEEFYYKKVKVAATLGEQWKQQVEAAKPAGGALSEAEQGHWMRIRMTQLNPQKESLDKKNPKLYDWLVYEAKQFVKAPKKQTAEPAPAAESKESVLQGIRSGKYPKSSAYLSRVLSSLPELQREPTADAIRKSLKTWIKTLQVTPTDEDIMAQIEQTLSH